MRSSSPRAHRSGSAALAAAFAIALLSFLAGRASVAPSAARPAAAAASAAASAAAQGRGAPLPLPLPPFRFAPEVSRVWINIGSHKDPPLPAAGSPEEAVTAVVAVEPIVQTAMRINGSARGHVHVVAAAVSDAAGFSSMETFNSGASSSLGEPQPGRWWAQPGAEHRTFGMPRFAFVPVLSLEMLLRAVPEELDIALLKTDMQGHDHRAVAAAGRAAIRRVRRLVTEVYCGGFVEYGGARNALEREWLPHMARMGFALDAGALAPCPPGHVGEADAVWLRVEEAAAAA